MTKERIENLGSLFRFLTPLLIAAIGWITINYLSTITKKFEMIDSKFDVFLETYHTMDKRIDKLEYKVFGEK
jgi:hypothetical protein